MRSTSTARTSRSRSGGTTGRLTAGSTGASRSSARADTARPRATGGRRPTTTSATRCRRGSKHGERATQEQVYRGIRADSLETGEVRVVIESSLPAVGGMAVVTYTVRPDGAVHVEHALRPGAEAPDEVPARRARPRAPACVRPTRVVRARPARELPRPEERAALVGRWRQPLVEAVEPYVPPPRDRQQDRRPVAGPPRRLRGRAPRRGRLALGGVRVAVRLRDARARPDAGAARGRGRSRRRPARGHDRPASTGASSASAATTRGASPSASRTG